MLEIQYQGDYQAVAARLAHVAGAESGEVAGVKQLQKVSADFCCESCLPIYRTGTVIRVARNADPEKSRLASSITASFAMLTAGFKLRS